MAWDKAVQPAFNGRCTGCHNGVPGPANPSYQIIDPATNMVVFSFTFDLTATPVMIPSEDGPQTYPASYVSIAGVDMEAVERLHLMIVGNYKTYAEPMNSRGSLLIQKINPTQVYPSPTTARAFATTAHSVDAGGTGYAELSPAEFLRIILAIDNGLNYYARENSAMHD
jgi:hypothetical protein